MFLTISGGVQKDINVGSVVTLNTNYIPAWFKSTDQFTVTKLEEYSGKWYPFVRFYKEEISLDSEDVEQVKVVIDEVSAVSPEIITGVLS